MLYGFNNITIM